MRQRVGEMREPPLGLEAVPDAALQMFFDEIQNAPTTELLILGIYQKALPALHRALEQHRLDSNPLTDSPTLRICRFAAMEIQEMIDFGTQAATCLINDFLSNEAGEWQGLLDLVLKDAGELEGGGSRANLRRAGKEDKTAFPYVRTRKRDERFSARFDMAVDR